MVSLADSLQSQPQQRQQLPLLGLALAALLHAAVALLALGTAWRVPEEPPIFEVIFAAPEPAPAPPAQPVPAPAEPVQPPAAAATPEPAPASEPPPALPIPEPPAEPAPRPIAPRPVAPRPATKPAPPAPAATPAESPPLPAAALPTANLPAPFPSVSPSPAPPAAAAPVAPPAPPGLPPLQAYAIQLRNLLAAHREYPHAARQRRQEGVVSIALTIDRAGQLAGVRLYAASIFPLLDEAALAMARRAAPFPPPPLEPHQRQAVFVVPVGFALQE